MGAIEELTGGFAELIGQLFLDSLLLTFAIIVLIILAVLAILGRLFVPKPWSWIVVLGCIGGIIYLVSNGGF